MISGIIFDFDNTLYDYDDVNKFALNKLFDKMSNVFDIHINIINVEYDKINHGIKNSNNSATKFNKAIYIKKLFEKLNIHLEHLLFYLNYYETIFFEKFVLYENIIKLFHLLKENNIKIGILSNNIFLQQYNKLEKLGINQYIDIIETSDECGEEKPNKSIFHSIQQKMRIPFENMGYVGDNIIDDIEPAMSLGMLSFWFQPLLCYANTIMMSKIIHFTNYNALYLFFVEYFQTTNEFVYLSKYFGQSILNVQGPGGNISIKMNNILCIKSSGTILGNVSLTQGYCLVDNDDCINMITTNNKNINMTKVLGNTVPSMETYFHSFMKKYTVHLHFTLSNIFMCSNNANIILENFYYPYKIVDYSIPGIILASNIYIY